MDLISKKYSLVSKKNTAWFHLQPYVFLCRENYGIFDIPKIKGFLKANPLRPLMVHIASITIIAIIAIITSQIKMAMNNIIN